MIYAKTIFVCSAFMFFSACGAGAFDYSEKIRGTGLIYQDSNTLDRSIVKIDREGGRKTLVGSTILDYKVKAGHVIGLRQIVNHYVCNKTRGDVEITDEIEFFAIKIPVEGDAYQYVSFNDFFLFEQYLEEKKVPSKVARSMRPALHESWMLESRPLGECVNAKLVDF